MRHRPPPGPLAAALVLALATGAGTAVAQNQAGPPAVAPDVDLSDRVARATATVLVGNLVRAQGVVLGGDGRVVTSLAALRDDRAVTLRYPDGRIDAATVVATDERWGLALLQPGAAYWREGLSFATRVRSNTPVRWAAGSTPRAVAGLLRRRRTFVGRDAELLRDAWEFAPAPSYDAIGSGVANAAGELVGVVVPPDPAVPAGGATAPFGVPVTVVQELVAGAGNTARPWLGLVARDVRPGEGGTAVESGLLVTSVAGGSPADRAGLRAGLDVIVGADHRPVQTTADLAAVLQGRHPGDTLLLRVVRRGTTMDLPVALAALPGQ